MFYYSFQVSSKISWWVVLFRLHGALCSEHPLQSSDKSERGFLQEPQTSALKNDITGKKELFFSLNRPAFSLENPTSLFPFYFLYHCLFKLRPTRIPVRNFFFLLSNFHLILHPPSVLSWPTEVQVLYFNSRLKNQTSESYRRKEEGKKISTLALFVAVALDPGTTGTFVTWTER